MDANLFEQWFVIADQDHDGMVSGSEAVEFFTRSSLNQETLFQVLLCYTSLVPFSTLDRTNAHQHACFHLCSTVAWKIYMS